MEKNVREKPHGKERTLAEIKEKITEVHTRNMARTTDHISRIKERLKTKTDPAEVERLNKLIAFHEDHLKALKKQKVETKAQAIFDKHK
jgi:cell pole-organizing protein PopZ